MTIMQVPHAWIKYSFLIGFVAVLTACGGGGGSKKQPDTTPNAFTFTSVTDAQLSTPVTSNTITINGIDAAASISITGGQYSLGGSAPTSAAGTITNGQTLTVTVTSSASTNASVTATVNIGGVSGAFTVTTFPSTAPNAFTFTPATDVEPSSVQTSNPITVAGIDIAVPISIVGGEYAIGEGEYTTEAGSVAPNQSVTARMTAPDGTAQTNEAVVTIGDIEGSFSVTTFADTQAPVAEFMFPPPMTMSEADSVIVRGTTTDYNQITRVQIMVNDSETLIDVTPVAEGDYSTWTATVPLATGVDNQIVVVTEDKFENVSDIESAARVVIRQDSTYRAAFPDEDHQFDQVRSIGLDQLNGRNRLLVMAGQVVSVDIATGKRTPFVDLSHENVSGFFGAAIDSSRGEIYFSNSRPAGTLVKANLSDPTQYELFSDSLYRYIIFSTLNTIGDLKVVSLRADSSSTGSLVETIVSTGHVSVLSDATLSIPDANNPFVAPASMVHDVERNRYLVADSGNVAIFSVDVNTGERAIFSSNSVGSGPNYGDSSQSSQLGTIALNTRTQQALVLEGRTGKVFSIDLVTATRNLISTTPFTGIVNPGIIFSGVAVDESCNCLYYSHRFIDAIATVDLVTGQHVILSKSAH